MTHRKRERKTEKTTIKRKWSLQYLMYTVYAVQSSTFEFCLLRNSKLYSFLEHYNRLLLAHICD